MSPARASWGTITEPFRHGGYAGGMESRNFPAPFWPAFANTEHGVLTDYGYLVKSGDEWQRVHEGPAGAGGIPGDGLSPAGRGRPGSLAPEPAAPAAVLPEAGPIIPKGQEQGRIHERNHRQAGSRCAAFWTARNYKSYLTSMSKFHTSFQNTMLIFCKAGRFPLWPGPENGNRITTTDPQTEKGPENLAPLYKVKKRVPKKTPTYRQPIKDKDGKTVMDEQEITVPDYHVASVYDVKSQTEGKEPRGPCGYLVRRRGAVSGSFRRLWKRSSPLCHFH